MADERKRRRRLGPTMGTGLGVSLPISIGLPIIAVGLALLLGASRSGRTALWAAGVVALAGGLAVFASGKRL